MSQVTGAVAAYALAFDASKLSASTIEHAKQAVLDVLGIAARARAESDTAKIVHRVIRELDVGGKTTAVAYGPQFSVQYAALLNGCSFSRAGFRRHARAVVTSSRRAGDRGGATVAEEKASNGRALLAAIVAGYDVTVRLGIPPSPYVSAVSNPMSSYQSTVARTSGT